MEIFGTSYLLNSNLTAKTGYPNYASRSIIVSGSSVKNDGYVSYAGNPNAVQDTWATITGSINGAEVFGVSSWTHTSAHNIQIWSGLYPVKKGDSITANKATIYYTPLK